MIRDNIDHLDQLLDKLEDLARSDVPSSQFLAVALEGLRSTISARLAVVMLHADGEQWWPLASSGPLTSATHANQAIAHQLAPAAGDKQSALFGSHAGEAWLAVPLRPGNFDKGYLLIVHTAEVAQPALGGLVELLTAFAEVLQVRHNLELEGFMHRTWDQVQGLCLQLSQAPSHEQAAAWLVGGLARGLDAARVSVFSSSGGSAPQLLAVSGVAKFNASADAARGLQMLAAELQLSGKPLLRQAPPQSPSTDDSAPRIMADGCFENLLGLRLATPEAAASTEQTATDRQQSVPASGLSRPTGLIAATWLIIEYPTQAEMIRSLARLPHILPTVAVAWEQQLRWLRLPKLARGLAFSSSRTLQTSLRRLTWPLLVAGLLLLIYAMRLPYPLTLEAQGTYEPVVSRAIYASDDGFVDELLVADGSVVAAGDPLVRLRAPALELLIEQVSGELRGVVEETSGIRIAINQLSPDAAESLSNQTRLASRIIELETKRDYLQRQLDMLDSQRAGLLLRAPIGGTIVAKDLQRHLASRPVRRGDALFSISDFAGPWQIRVQVADRDATYLRAHYASQQAPEKRDATERETPTTDPRVTFALISKPAARWSATVRNIADHVENRHGQGCYVEVRADVDSAQQTGAHAGAGVHAFFPCGRQPFWFVWSRPLVEAVQRKLWFRNPTDE